MLFEGVLDTSGITIGPYRLLNSIGEGSQGRVFAARTPDGRRVALKLLGAGGEADGEVRHRFEREVRAVHELRHPRLLPLLDSGWDPRCGFFLVSPLIDGQNLRQFSAERRLSPEAVAAVLRPVLEGLAALHQAGFVHRDIKPENVLLGRGGQVWLADFGLVLRPEEGRLTCDGRISGTVPYLSPEQIQGQTVCSASDVWAAGVLAYELVAGRRPFERALVSEEVAAILRGGYSPLHLADRRVSAAFSDLVGSCLEPDPATRPADAGVLLDRLLELPEVEHGTDLERLANDPDGFEAEVAARRLAELRSQADEALARGDSFQALSLLDRALAYQPGDPGAQALIERAMALSGTAATSETARPWWRRRGLVIAAAVLSILLCGAGFWTFSGGRGGEALALTSASAAAQPAPAPVVTAMTPPSAGSPRGAGFSRKNEPLSDDDRALFATVGRLAQVMQRGMKKKIDGPAQPAREALETRQAPSRADRTAVALTGDFANLLIAIGSEQEGQASPAVGRAAVSMLGNLATMFELSLEGDEPVVLRR